MARLSAYTRLVISLISVSTYSINSLFEILDLISWLSDYKAGTIGDLPTWNPIPLRKYIYLSL